MEVLAEATGLYNGDIRDHAEELVTSHLLRGDAFKFGTSPGKPLDFLLTRKGRAFFKYYRGVSTSGV